MPSKKQKNKIQSAVLLASLFAFAALFLFSLVALNMINRQSLDNRSDASSFEMVEEKSPVGSCGSLTGDAQRACERAALMALYNSAGGPNWRNKQGWDTSVDYCTWHGIRCHNNQLYWIDLTNNNLTGIIPPDLGNLDQLENLTLMYNSLTGVIPREIGNMTNLQVLALNRNSLSGTIPVELSNLSRLTQLALDHNNLSGSIPAQLGLLSNLRSIDLNNNQLAGSIPTAIGELTQLTNIVINSNRLTGAIPTSFTNLTALRTFLFNTQQSGPNAICVATPAVRDFLTAVENLNPNGDDVQPGPSIQEGLPDCANSFTTSRKTPTPPKKR